MRAILHDGVWTPFRAHRVGAGTEACIHCGVPQAGVAHLWWDCKALPRDTFDAQTDGWAFPQLQQVWQREAGQPPCLWRTGTVPTLYMPNHTAPFANLEDSRGFPSIDALASTVTVFTDGSAIAGLAPLVVGMGFMFPPFRPWIVLALS